MTNTNYPAHDALAEMLKLAKAYVGSDDITVNNPVHGTHLISEFNALITENQRLQAIAQHYEESLKDIGITAQMASLHEPEQFCEWAYNAVQSALNLGAAKEGGE